MSKRMLIDATHPEETRAVVLDNRHLVDFDFETGENVYNDSIFCQNEYAFLATPERR